MSNAARRHRPPRSIAAAAAVLALLTAGCSSAVADAPSSAPSATGASSAPAGAPPTASGALPAGLTVEGPAGWTDQGGETFHHWLAPEVKTDPTAERWADIAVYVPTLAYDPMTGAPGPVPTDLPEWMRGSRMFTVIDEGTVDVDGVEATRLDVQISEQSVNVFANPYLNLISGAGPDGPSYERFVLVPTGGGWLVVQASTGRGRKGITSADEPDDRLAAILASLDLPDGAAGANGSPSPAVSPAAATGSAAVTVAGLIGYPDHPLRLVLPPGVTEVDEGPGSRVFAVDGTTVQLGVQLLASVAGTPAEELPADVARLLSKQRDDVVADGVRGVTVDGADAQRFDLAMATGRDPVDLWCPVGGACFKPLPTKPMDVVVARPASGALWFSAEYEPADEARARDLFDQFLAGTTVS